MRGKRLILLDTNVWSSVAAFDDGERLRLAARGAGVDIVSSPAVIYELLRTPDPELRRRDILVATRPCWLRPMPEVYQRAEEVRNAIKRRHPGWILRRPDLRFWRQLVLDWAGPQPAGRVTALPQVRGFWWRARHEPDRQARLNSQVARVDLDIAREGAKVLRAELRQKPIEQMVLGDWKTSFHRELPGWDGEPVDSWRVDGLQEWTLGLTDRSSAHHDWLSPYLDLGLVLHKEFAAWVQFWLYELDPTEVPIQWLTWALGMMAGTKKVTPGTPADNQIGQYLTDCDAFASCDRGFVEVVRRIADQAPCPLAAPKLLPKGRDCMDALLDWIASGCS